MALRRRLLWLILFALVAAQTLGLVHRIAHGGNIGAVNFVSATQSHLTGGNWSDALKAGHADDVTCHVFDQASPGGCVWLSPPALPAIVFADIFIARSKSEALARWAALFEARGPPTFR